MAETTPESLSPLARFHAWQVEAAARETSDPTRMALATVDEAGRPSVRMVLLKHADERGFVFYTNLESPKARHLQARPFAELCLHWPLLERQVRVAGTVEPVSDAEADDYFASRPRLSQLGAWASRQSQPMDGYFELEREVTKMALRFPFGRVPRPPFWSGFRVRPEWIEFWQQKAFRHHERVRCQADQGRWREQWLFP